MVNIFNIFRKRNKEVPKDILEDFNLAEEKLKGGMKNGRENKTNPYGILWDIAKGKGIRERSESAIRTEQKSVGRELPAKPLGGQGVQDRDDNNIKRDTGSNNRFRKNNIRNIISGIRRRTDRTNRTK